MKSPRLLPLVVLLLFPIALLARDAREQARIDYLIAGVEKSADVKFIRNSTEYSGTAAAAHLRMKLGYLGERVKTAEDFIKYCASESSVTHQKYRVRLPNGVTRDASDYFAERLREFDQRKK